MERLSELEVIELVDNYVIDNSKLVIAEIAKVFDYDNGNYCFLHFCDDGEFEILETYPIEDDKFCVDALGSICEGSLMYMSDGLEPYASAAKIKFSFFVNMSDVEHPQLEFYHDNDGMVDIERTLEYEEPDDNF